MGVFQRIKSLLKNKSYPYRSMSDQGFLQITGENFISFSDGTQLTGTQKIDTRENKKPVEVWELLKDTSEPVVDTTNLDEKIKVVKDRIDTLIDFVGSTRDLGEESNVLGWLQARKKYAKFKHLFAYPTTNEQSIKELCQAYKLKVATLSQYSGTMPQEAIVELSKFKQSCLKIRKEKPVVRLIVPDNDPKTETRKRDPILLVSSPFGNWDYILGAWDKEVLIVDELVYMGK